MVALGVYTEAAFLATIRKHCSEITQAIVGKDYKKSCVQDPVLQGACFNLKFLVKAIQKGQQFLQGPMDGTVWW